MPECVDFSEVVEIGLADVDGLTTTAELHPDSTVEEGCMAFSKQVCKVDGAVRFAYALAARVAKRSTDGQEQLDIWQAVVRICDSAIPILSRLKEQYPYCGTPELYNSVLDYKLACQERIEDVQEELKWQEKAAPQGLFQSA